MSIEKTDQITPQLILNILESDKQYEDITAPSDTEIFLTPDNLEEELANKQDKLPDGTTGYVLTKTDDGVGWTGINSGILNISTEDTSIIAEGSNKLSSARKNSTTYGITSSAGGDNSTAIGYQSSAVLNSTAVGYYAKTGGFSATAIGYNTTANSYSLALGYSANASANTSIAIGDYASATASHAIQIGTGTNSEANTLSVAVASGQNYKLLGSDGLIPKERLSSNVPTSGQVLAFNGVDLSWVDAQDGEWVNCDITLANNATYPTYDNIIYDLTEYIPKDGHRYEVLVYGFVTPSKSAGAYINLVLTTSEQRVIGVCNSRASNGTYAYSDCATSTIILPTDRQIIVNANSGYTGTFLLSVYAYKKLGKI